MTPPPSAEPVDGEVEHRRRDEAEVDDVDARVAEPATSASESAGEWVRASRPTAMRGAAEEARRRAPDALAQRPASSSSGTSPRMS